MSNLDYTIALHYVSSSENDEDDGISSFNGHHNTGDTPGASPIRSSNKSSVKGLIDESAFRSLLLATAYPTRANTASNQRNECQLNSCCQII